MIKDLDNALKFFQEQIKDIENESMTIKNNILKIIKVLLNFRQDISYSKPLMFLAMFFYFNSDNYYNAFVNLTNFISKSFLYKYLTKDEIYVNILLKQGKRKIRFFQ